jgi:hypothetical protein
MKSFLLTCFLVISTSYACAQSADYSVSAIPDSLKQNANAVIRLAQLDISIESQRNMVVNEKRALTIFNSKGLEILDAVQNYDRSTTIRNIEATVFDANGIQLKKLRRKDFKDQLATDDATLFSDSRVLYLDYTPTQYPFTIVYECETVSSNTAFLPAWMPISHYYVGLEKSTLRVTCPQNLGFKKKELHFSAFPIDKKTDTPELVLYEANNIVAQKYEDYSPTITDIYPRVIMGLDLFQLEGVQGSAKTWKEFGQWFSEKILSGTDELSEETKQKARALVGDEKDPVKKARIIYRYVQSKSRYVSIQEGIGGWRPMAAKDVDRLGYGDCKALSNYTRALLEAVDVPAYYTRAFATSGRRNMVVPDFVSMQFNHVILAIPNGNDYYWMECTSQTDPFNYQAGFTDNRNVLVLKPDGGEIVKTKVYADRNNSQISKGSYSISENGLLLGTVAMTSEGSQYDKYHIENVSPINKEAHYKDYWSNIGNLKIKNTAFVNDKEKISFIEKIDIEAMNYGNLSGSTMMFPINAYNQSAYNVKRVRNRRTPFEIQNGAYDEDEIAVALPNGFTIEALPKNFELSGKYGEYKTELVQQDNAHLVYKRKLYLKEGLYPSNEYEDFRQFMEQVSRNDNAKIVLIKNQ